MPDLHTILGRAVGAGRPAVRAQTRGAVRLRLYKALTVYMDKEGCVHVDEPDDMPGFIDAITAALATPPPVPAAPPDMEMHHVLDAIADDEDGGPDW